MSLFLTAARPVRAAARLAAAALALAAAPALAQFQTLDVPYVPTPEAVVQAMLRLADVRPDDYVIDLGSGDGRIAIAAVRDRQARGALGVDIDPDRVAEARANARNAGVADKVQFRQQDLFKTDFSQATVLTMYLLPDVNLKLRPVILDKLPAGTRVVSHAFTMAEWEPDATEEVDGRRVYLWIVPAKVQGQWQVSGPQGGFTLSLTQDFQRVQGTAQRQGRSLPIADARLRGARLQFTLDGQRYEGEVGPGGITAVAAPGAAAGWRATR
ncbi:methyltransferase domain-containing protein [Orrella sp. JC864]|uniref:methyltransferase domain-containing protein n=1 Tax=Orrella sp. JC864 TaxID=3120298 RepID=UPI0012BC2882